MGNKAHGGILILLAFLAVTTRGQTTSFTYQGDLMVNNTPANGLFDIGFSAYNDPINGTLIGGPVTNIAIGISNGVFTAQVDFGASPFIGGNVWLQLAVSPSGSNMFSTLSPRQQITPVPYALYSFAAGTSYTQTNPTTGTIVVNSNGVLVSPSGFFSSNASGIVSALGGQFVTNGSSGLTLAGRFSGDGSGLSNVTATAVVGGPSIAQLDGRGSGAHLSDSVFIADANAAQTYFVNLGTSFGSTVGIMNMSHVGYSDINFYHSHPTGKRKKVLA